MSKGLIIQSTVLAAQLLHHPFIFGLYRLLNYLDCLTLQILSTKTYNRRFLPNPTDKCARQCSGARRLWLEAPLHWLAYLSVGFAQHHRLYRLCGTICNIGAIFHFKEYLFTKSVVHKSKNFDLSTRSVVLECLLGKRGKSPNWFSLLA